MLPVVDVVCERHSLHNRYTKCLLLVECSNHCIATEVTNSAVPAANDASAIELSKRTASIPSPTLPLGQCRHRLA